MLPTHRRFAGGATALPAIDADAPIRAMARRTAIGAYRKGAAHNALVNTGNPR